MDKDYDNLFEDYPDLDSDSPRQQPPPQQDQNIPQSQPSKKVKPNQEQNSGKPVFKVPHILGGQSFVPPPPPPGKRPPQNKLQPHQSHQPHQPHQSYPSQPRPYQQPYRGDLIKERERKCSIYLKNLPKHYNESDKLMTFFRNEGIIKQIKTNPEESSAMVRFAKEEQALKFAQSKKAVFNRKFIFYSLNEKDTVPTALLKEKDIEQNEKFKKPLQIEHKQMKQKIEALLADKCRALLFLQRYIEQESAQEMFKADLKECKDIKEDISKMNYEECVSILKMGTSQYDWTLSYLIKSPSEIEKKTLFYEIQKNYGPISSLDLRHINPTAPLDEPQKEQSYQYIVKLTFLAVKHSWLYFSTNCSQMNEENKDINLQVEGSKIKGIFLNQIAKLQVKKKEEEEQVQEEVQKNEQPQQEGQSKAENSIN